MSDTHKLWAEKMLVGGGSDENWNKCQGVAQAFLSQQAELAALRKLRDAVEPCLHDLAFSPGYDPVRLSLAECEAFKETT